MARYTDATCRLCRREGLKLFLKGTKCYTGKCAIEKRNYAPGQHGQQRKKTSEYGIQLREKQKVRRFYGVLESQFRKYFVMASRKQGKTGENLLSLLETRFDNTVYRLGLATSRAEARQLVNHAHFTINGKKVNIPSYLIKSGDVIAIREKSKSSEKFVMIQDAIGGNPIPKWLEFDVENLVGRVVAMPTREDIDLDISEHLIVELYSK